MDMDVEGIKDRLIIRYPYLMVDRVEEINEEGIRAIKNVTVNEPFYQGHFPAPHPSIMPGTLIIESMAQVAGLLAVHRAEGEAEMGYLVGIDGVRFKRNVVPGDRLVIRGEILRRRSGFVKSEVKSYVEDELVTEAEILLSIEED